MIRSTRRSASVTGERSSLRRTWEAAAAQGEDRSPGGRLIRPRQLAVGAGDSSAASVQARFRGPARSAVRLLAASPALPERSPPPAAPRSAPTPACRQNRAGNPPVARDSTGCTTYCAGWQLRAADRAPFDRIHHARMDADRRHTKRRRDVLRAGVVANIQRAGAQQIGKLAQRRLADQRDHRLAVGIPGRALPPPTRPPPRRQSALH